MAQAEYSVAVDISTKNAEAQLNRLQQQITGLGSAGTKIGQNLSSGISSGVSSVSGQIAQLQSRLSSLRAGDGITTSLRGAQSQIAALEGQLGKLGSTAGSNIGTNISRSVSSGVAAAEQSISRLNKDVASIGGGSLKKATSGLASELGAFPAAFDKVRNAVLATTAVVGGAGLAGALISTTAEFQDLRSALNTVYGSVQDGNAAFKIIQDFATKTPFDVSTLTKAFITLKAQGLNPTKDLLTTFSDAASVSTDRMRTFDALVRITSRSLAGGLGLEELNQVAEAGLPVFDILQKKLGLTRLDISEVGKTAEGSQKLLKALIDGLNERFGGATERTANNLSVSLSNLGDAARNAMDVIGSNGLGQAINEAASGLSNWIANNHEAAVALGQGLGNAVRVVSGLVVVLADNITLIGSVLAGWGVAKATTGLLSFGAGAIESVKGITALVSGLRAGSVAFSELFGPIGLIVGGLTTLGVYLYNTSDGFKSFADTIGRYVINGLMNAITAIGNFGKATWEVAKSLGSFLSGNLNAFSGIGQRISATQSGYRSLNQTIIQGSQASKTDAQAKKDQAAATAAANNQQKAWNSTFNQSLGQYNQGKPALSGLTDAQKKHADQVKQFTDNLKDQISTLQIDIQTMGQSNSVHDAAIRLRDAEKLGIAGQTAALRDKITALQQEKAEKVFAGNFKDYIANMNAETAALSLNRKEREIALAVLQQENAAKAAGTTLTADQKKQLEAALRANQAAKAAAEARDKAEDDSAQKAIDRQKELQDAINGTSTAYGNAGNAANNMFSAGGATQAGQSLGQAIVESLFGKTQKVQANADGTVTNKSAGSSILDALFGTNKSYSTQSTLYNTGSGRVASTIPTFNGTTLGVGSNGQVLYNTANSSSGSMVQLTVTNTGNPIDPTTLNQIVSATATAVREALVNEQRSGGLLYGR